MTSVSNSSFSSPREPHPAAVAIRQKMHPLQIEREMILQPIRCFMENSMDEVAEMIVDYLLLKGYFGPSEWKKHWNLQPKEYQLPSEFWVWWKAKDHLSGAYYNYETHYPPCLVPDKCKDQNGGERDYDLKLLSQFIKNPKEGDGAQFEFRSTRYECFRQSQEIKTDKAHYVVMRKELFCRGKYISEIKDSIQKLNEKTGACYENLPNVVDLSTFALGFHAMTGKRVLSDGTGEEKQGTYSYTKQENQWVGFPMQVYVGGFGPEVDPNLKVSLGCSFQKGSDSYNAQFGVALVRIFNAVLDKESKTCG